MSTANPPVKSGESAAQSPDLAPDGTPQKLSWKQYVAAFVKAPAKARAALIGSLLLVSLSPSAFAALTPFVVPAYAMDTGTPAPDAILLFVTLPIILGPLFLPFAGRWVDRHGAKRFALLSVILYAITTAAIPLAGQSSTPVLAITLVISSVFGFAASLGIVFKVIGAWFPQHRGIGFGLVGVMASVAAAALSPVFQWLINGNAPQAEAPPAGAELPSGPPPAGMEAAPVDPSIFMGVGWDGVYYIIAIAIAVIGIPTVLWLISEPKIAPVEGGPKVVDAMLPGVPFWKAVPTRAWIFILLVLTLAATGPVAMRQNAVDFYGTTGIDAAAVSIGLSLLFTTSVIGLFIGGAVLDRARHPWVVAVLVAAVPIGLALALINTGSVPLMYLSMACLGFATGAEAAFGPSLLVKYFGLKSLAALQGLVLAVSGAALALAPYIVSAIQAETGSYTIPFLVVTGLTAVAAIIAALLPKYPKPWALEIPPVEAAPGRPATD